MEKEFNLSEKRKEIIKELDENQSWKRGSRRYIVEKVLEKIEYQDKEFIKLLKEELKVRWVDEAKKLGEEEFTATSVGELFELFGEEIDKLAGEKLI